MLKAEYKRGVDLVYEAVGGDMFETAVDALADKGCLLVIGMMSQYAKGWPVAQHPGLPEKLLKKSARLQGAEMVHRASLALLQTLSYASAASDSCAQKSHLARAHGCVRYDTSVRHTLTPDTMRHRLTAALQASFYHTMPASTASIWQS